jgi:hypothetical protein
VTQSRYGNGAIGAALALLLTEAFIVVAGFVMVGHDVLDRFMLRRAALVTVAAAGMWGAAYLVRPFGPIVEILVGALVFAALAFAFRIIRPEQIELVRTMIRNRRGRG